MGQIVYRNIKDLHLLENNPRKISVKEMEKLITSIQNNHDYFEARPLILSDRTGEFIILAGNQRYKAAKKIGLKEVPTFLIENLTEEREKEIIIRDNVSNGEWDYDILKTDWNIDNLNNWGVDTKLFAIEKEEVKEDNYEEPEKLETNIKRGDIYEIEGAGLRHRLMCGDSTSIEDVTNLVGGGRR
jgi:ParB-like chromosome segregation protein Spo0J